MNLLHVLEYPSQILTTPCKAIEDITDDVRALANDMIETMHIHRAHGLAAPQVGHNICMCIVRDAPAELDATFKAYVFINPTIAHRSTESYFMKEGCLSMPGVFIHNSRAKEVIVRATNLAGEQFAVKMSDLEAAVIQHEIDHLHGVMFFERCSRWKRKKVLEKWKTPRRVKTSPPKTVYRRKGRRLKHPGTS